MPVILLIIMFWAATAAQAGPWLRPIKEGFLSVDSFASAQPGLLAASQYNGLYLEYGLHEMLTLGVTGGMDHNRDGSLTLYLTQPMRRTSAGWPRSYNFGIGGRIEGQKFSPHLRFGTSVGRGGLFPNGRGWVQIDAHTQLSARRSPSIKLETTLGTKGHKNWLYLCSLTVEKTSDTPWSMDVSPSVALPLRKRQHVLIGLTASTLEGGRFGLKSSVWYRF